MAADHEQILRELAPCGLDCSRCFAYADGAIPRLARGLSDALTGFENLVPRIAGHVPALASYPQFTAILDFLKGGTCAGCRTGDSPIPFCAAKTCHREKGVDFCFQCDEYPCTRNAYPENLAVRWRAANDRMKEAGVETFYAEQKQRPRY